MVASGRGGGVAEWLRLWIAGTLVLAILLFVWLGSVVVQPLPRDERMVFGAPVVPVVTPAPAATVAPAPVVASPPPPALPRTRVVIDPGHGGNDQGGSGKLTTDRDVAFAVATAVHRLLSNHPRFDVYLTRGTEFVKLDERTALARRVDADCFVSLHANVWKGKGEADGVEVSYASQALAQSELARMFLERGLALTPEDAARIVQVQRETLEKSRALANLMLVNVVHRTGQRPRVVREKGYRVLRPYDIPSCLIELGFLSNPGEEALMASVPWQERAARGIVDALEQWTGLAPALTPVPPLPAPPPPIARAVRDTAPPLVGSRRDTRHVVRRAHVAAPRRPVPRAVAKRP